MYILIYIYICLVRSRSASCFWDVAFLPVTLSLSASTTSSFTSSSLFSSMSFFLGHAHKLAHKAGRWVAWAGGGLQFFLSSSKNVHVRKQEVQFFLSQCASNSDISAFLFERHFLLKDSVDVRIQEAMSRVFRSVPLFTSNEETPPSLFDVQTQHRTSC